MIAWKIGGDQGEGIDSTGDILSVVLSRMGYFIYGYKSFSSRVKGGHTHYKIRISGTPVESPTHITDILVALNQETLDKHASELDGGVIVADSAFSPQSVMDQRARLVALPLTDMARRHGSRLMRNLASVGASATLMGLRAEPFAAYIREKFAAKGQATVEANLAVFEEGRMAVQAFFPDPPFLLPEPVREERMVITGNDAFALGALAGGCRLMFGYPITPATDIMESLTRWLPHVGGAVVQMEDELASITAAVGSGYAGVRAMTATSGPGLSLMQEGIGLASMAEIPVVVVDTQRAGPSTGMATKQEQSDLMAIIHGGHGDSPRIVLTPGSIEESFEDGIEAFNLAEMLQTPVIVATDLMLALSPQSIQRSVLNGPEAVLKRGTLVAREELSGGFNRYRFTDSGVSPRSLPGDPWGQYLATGAEHAPIGNVSEDPENRRRMVEKRLRKLDQVHGLRIGMKHQGSKAAQFVLVGIGSTVGTLREAATLLGGLGIQAAVAWFRTLAPFPLELCRKGLAGHEHVMVVEHSATGQLYRLLHEYGVADGRFISVTRYDGVPWSPLDIVLQVEEFAHGKVGIKS